MYSLPPFQSLLQITIQKDKERLYHARESELRRASKERRRNRTGCLYRSDVHKPRVGSRLQAVQSIDDRPRESSAAEETGDDGSSADALHLRPPRPPRTPTYRSAVENLHNRTIQPRPRPLFMKSLLQVAGRPTRASTLHAGTIINRRAVKIFAVELENFLRTWPDETLETREILGAVNCMDSADLRWLLGDLTERTRAKNAEINRIKKGKV